MPEVQSAEDLKDAGNAAFRAGENARAIELYSEALQLDPEKPLRIVLYRNRAMVKLKTDDHEGAEFDCTQVLELDGADSKALYRRALAREQLEKFGAAFQDAKEALRLEPKDKQVQKLCEHLMKENKERVKVAQSTENKVKEMMRLTFDPKTDKEQQLTALNNCLVLARETEEGAKKIWQNGKFIEQSLPIIKDKEGFSDLFSVGILRVLDELLKRSSRAFVFIDFVPIPVIARLMAIRPESQSFVDNAFSIVQRIFNALAAMDRSKEKKPDVEVAERNKERIVKLILELEDILTDPQYNAKVRESVIDLFCKNLMHMDGGLPRGWSWRFTEDRGLLKLLHIASQVPEQCDYPVSAETRQHVAICLARLYDDMVFDTKRTIYKEKVDSFFGHILTHAGERGMKVKLAALLITLLQGPVDIGMGLVTNDDVTGTMLSMASSDDHLSQSLAAELIVQTASKHERATKLLQVGLPVLRKLYESSDHGVKVRALMGLCKIASAGGDDASKAMMREEEVLRLAETCRAFLNAVDQYSIDVRRFACEGLSYLSLDADVKEWIVSDPNLLKALVSLAQSAGSLCVYTVASIYVNMTNSYEKPKVDEELVKLAQFAKHHVPEVHLKDTEEFVEKRIRALVSLGSVTACIAVSKTESKNALELLARCMFAFCTIPDLTGTIIAEGGAKLLLTLYKSCDGEGKIKAAHALAKLGSRVDPSIAFAGQRVYEVIKPMVELLHPDLEGKSNYEALLTLTNLASASDSVRKRILKEKAVPKIEDYWFMTDHDDLRSAAAETMLNLMYNDEFYEDVLAPGTDKLKCWFLYCAEECPRLQLAATGALAMLTNTPEAGRRIIDEVKSWPDCMKEMAMAEDPEVQRRGIMAIANMIEGDEKVACEIIASDVFRVLVAITKLNNGQRVGAQQEAQRALTAAETKWKIIKPTDRQLYERTHNVATIAEE